MTFAPSSIGSHGFPTTSLTASLAGADVVMQSGIPPVGFVEAKLVRSFYLDGLKVLESWFQKPSWR